MNHPSTTPRKPQSQNPQPQISTPQSDRDQRAHATLLNSFAAMNNLAVPAEFESGNPQLQLWNQFRSGTGSTIPFASHQLFTTLASSSANAASLPVADSSSIYSCQPMPQTPPIPNPSVPVAVEHRARNSNDKEDGELSDLDGSRMNQSTRPLKRKQSSPSPPADMRSQAKRPAQANNSHEGDRQQISLVNGREVEGRLPQIRKSRPNKPGYDSYRPGNANGRFSEPNVL